MQKLSSLELQGYKTFASKTIFEFPEPITAVVGPNGSGKSNIADAVRWVLGEQAYSLLRGKKTEDMIFAGSEDRPRSSMASVAVTFNNDDGWLPIEFSSVNIARRAYRSGENEYLINKQRVRLREINEILANAGLAERTYTIIGQGLVDTALSLRPEERRLFFEEAAGIGLFRARRDEAIQKIETTHRNIERAQDILNELEPRLTKLNQQVTKLKDYERRKADLALMLKDWYGFQWNELQKNFSKAYETKRKQEATLSVLKKDLHRIETEIDDYRNKIENARDEYSALHNISANLHLEKQELLQRLAILEERQKFLFQKKTDIEHNLLQNNNEIEISSENLSNYQKKKVEIDKRNKNTKEKLQLISNELNDAKNIKSMIEGKIKLLQIEKTDKERDIVSITTKIDESIQSVGFFENNQNKYLEIKNKNIKEREKIEEITQELIEVKNNHQREFDILENEIAELTTCIQQLASEKEELKELIDNDEIEISSLQKQIEIIDETEKNLADLTSGAKSLLVQLNKTKKPSNYSLFLSEIEIEPGYETAITAVIGDHLEGIIFEGIQDPEVIFQNINDEINKTYLLFSDLIKSNDVSSSVMDVNLSPAINYIHSKKYNHILKIILKSTYIVQNRTEALRYIRNVENYIVIVTKNGEVFHNSGIIQTGKSSARETFKKREEKIYLSDTLSKILKQIEDKRNKTNAIISKLEKKRVEQQEKEKKLLSVKEAIGKIDVEIQDRTMAINDIQQKINFYKEQFDLVDDQKQDKHLLLENLQGRLSDLTEQKNKINKEEKALFDKNKEVPIDDLSQENLKLQTEIQIIAEALKYINIRINDTKLRSESLLKQKKQLDKSMDDTQQEIENIISERDNISKRNKAIDSELTNKKNLIEPIENLLAEKEKAQQKLIDQLEKSRQKIILAERHYMQAELHVEKIANEIENLKERIYEDFGIVSYEYEKQISGPKPLPIEGIVEKLPKITELPHNFEEEIKHQKATLKRLGDINPESEKEYQEVAERCNFISSQLEDLNKAEKDLGKIISELDDLMREGFNKTFKKVNEEFSKIFQKLFGGGSARLIISDEVNIIDTGIDIDATLPGRRRQELALLPVVRGASLLLL